jgi:3-deoxy-D-manno-octulosonate 8-phosphate phosphatase (KDO 8-P phosphatase)
MESVLMQYSQEVVLQARNIKAIIFDVDGVLTDGGIIYDNHANEFKKFNVKDGQIIKHLKAQGIILGAITGRNSPVVQRRCEELKLDFHHHGIKDKLGLFQEILQEYDLQSEEVMYIGDDIIDLGILKSCGLGVCPEDAKPYVKAHADLVTFAAGGKGVLREAADLVLAAQGYLEKVIASYLPN